jgi:hypothetical protein
MQMRAASIPAYERQKVTAAGGRVADLYTAWGKTAQAAEWKRKVSS